MIPLMPLRIPAGFAVCHNGFYDVDPICSDNDGLLDNWDTIKMKESRNRFEIRDTIEEWLQEYISFYLPEVAKSYYTFEGEKNEKND